MDELRSLFHADQQALVTSQVPSRVGVGLPSDTSASVAPSNAANLRPRNEYVGWGGQAIPDSQGFRVPWFGRTRVKGSHQRTKAAVPTTRGDQPANTFGRPSLGLQGATPGAAGPYDNSSQDALPVEHCLALIQKLPKSQRIPDRIYRALYHFDSRVLSLLLKDLSKAQLSYRAVELFDYLRSLDGGHQLASLCDVYTYTAMISMCIYQQDADRAMELMDDMCVRNIERNVHTYTALMNVCIKCGKYTLALDIYNSMRAANISANVVTYNSLVDVYGKLAQWEKAAHVLQLMKSENVQPVLRTYNTVLIACNMSNQPREALAIYHQMLTEGFTPNSTTYNALISAYGKIGQLDKVLEVYKEMVYKNCERTVITYSSLISACEKAGRWELALKLFNDMQSEGCVPNTVTYNSLITACAQGAQWEQASRVFEQMQAQGCTPDVVTYTALISAFERAGQWQLALQAFQQMCIQGCRPDAIVYNAIIDTLWETGVSWAQQKALQLFQTALKQMHFQQQPISCKGSCAELNLHAMTAGVAMLSLYIWMQEIRSVVSSQGELGLPPNMVIVTDKGKNCKEQGNHIVKEAVAAMMSFWESPFRMVQDGAYGGMLVADSHSTAAWVMSPKFNAQLSCLFPFGDAAKDSGFSVDDAIAKREAPVEDQCSQAFSLVQQFENTHGLNLQNMGSSYLARRSALVDKMVEQGSKLGLQDEVVHDSVLLMDRAVSASKEVHNGLLPLVSTASVSLAAKQGESKERQPSPEDLQATADINAQAIQEMEFNICRVLGGDTQAISAMRCLCVFLERLGHGFMDIRSQHGLSGLAKVLVTGALFDSAFLNCRPSVVAAAILYAERRLRGCIPFWPSMLAKLTGHQDMTSPELTVAVGAAQKLCRNTQFAVLYKDQACSWAPVPQLLAPKDLPVLAANPSVSGPYLAGPAASLYPAGQLGGLALEDDSELHAANVLHAGKQAGPVLRMHTPVQGQWPASSLAADVALGWKGDAGAAAGGYLPYGSQPLWGEDATAQMKMQQQMASVGMHSQMMLRQMGPSAF